MPANSDNDNGHDKGSSTNLSSVVGSTPLKATPSTPTESPFKPQVLIDQEKTEPEKVDELWSKILEVSKPTKKGHYSCIQPNSTIIHNTPSLGDTLIDQPSMSLEIVEKSVEPSTDIPRASMPAAKIPVQEALFQEGNGTPFNLDLQGQEVYISPKDKDTIEIGNKDIDPPIPHISEVSNDKDAQQVAITDPNLDTIKMLSLNLSF